MMNGRIRTATSAHRFLAMATFGLLVCGSSLALTSCAEEEPEPVCGDDRVNDGDEECDGDDFDGRSCFDFGFDEGTLGCQNSCKVDTTACVILDEDQDGLSIYDEEIHGSDPLNPDSDGDGILDGAEVQSGSNPTDMFSWPQGQGMWPNRLQAAINDGLTPTGWNIGDIAYNSLMSDQFGKEVQLYQFYGYPVVVSVGAFWCPPCKQAAATSQQLWEEHLPQGVIFVEMLVDGNTPGIKSTLQDLENWSSQYNIHFPVCSVDIAPSAQAIPTFYLLNSDMTINRKVEGFPGDPTLSSYIDDLY